MSSLFLFTGDNTYLAREEKKRWVLEFTKKYGADNIRFLDGTQITMRDLLDEVSTKPLFSEKLLVIVHSIPSSTKESMQSIGDNIHPDVILLFLDAKPDKRSASVKALLSIADVKDYKIVKGDKLLAWIREEAVKHGGTFEKNAERLLVEYLGEDQEFIAEEIRKLSMAAQGRIITTDMIEMMTIPTDEGVIWRISDYLCDGSRARAQTYALRMLDRGSEPYDLWSMLLSFLRNTVMVRAAYDAGLKSGKEIAEATGIHPFAVRSLLSYAKKIDWKKLQIFVEWASEADTALKSGKLRTSDVAPQEIHALIDLFLLSAP